MRLTGGEAPGIVKNVQGVTDQYGTQLTWDPSPDPGISYYEVYRGTQSDFEPGAGHYLASVNDNHYLDRQVIPGLTNHYYYKVRAVKAGRKGKYSNAAGPTAGLIGDTRGPSAPTGLEGHARNASRVSLTWEPSSDDVSVKGYKIYRNNEEIKSISSGYQSYLDTDADGHTSYTYSIKADDDAGNLSDFEQSHHCGDTGVHAKGRQYRANRQGNRLLGL